MSADVPKPASDDATATRARLVRLYDEIAATYGTALDLPDFFGRELVAAARLERGDRVLDVGCGRGACLRPALEVVGETGFVLGIDLSPEMVTLLSRELRRDRVTNAEIRVGDAENVDRTVGAFDAVTCGLTAHHFPHLTAALAACREALRPGGRFAASMLADGAVDYPWVLEALAETDLFGPKRAAAPGHTMLSAPELTQAMIESGYERIATTRVEHRFVFADVDAYLTWVRSQGLGTVVNRLRPEQLRRFVDACARRLEQHRFGPDGYELHKAVDLTVAIRP